MWVVWGIAGLLLGAACSSEDAGAAAPFGTDGNSNYGTDGNSNFGTDGNNNFGTDGNSNFGTDGNNNFGTEGNNNNSGTDGNNNNPGTDSNNNFGTDSNNNNSGTDSNNNNPGTDSNNNPGADTGSTDDSSGGDPVDCDATLDCYGACWGCALDGLCAGLDAACTANAQCRALQNCLSPTCDALGGQAWQDCYDNCVQQHPGGEDMLRQIWTCVYCDACASSCGSVGFDCTPHTPADCTPGERRCAGDVVQICSDTTHTWTDNTTCANGCRDGVCLPSTSAPKLVGYLLSVGNIGGVSAFDSIDFTAVDVLIHAFATAGGSNTEQVVGVNDDFTNYRTAGLLTKARAKNPGIKILFSLGGANHSYPMKANWGSASWRNNFAANVANAVVNWGYDGVDLDLEFPVGDQEPGYFTELLKAIYNAVKAKGSQYLVFFGVSPGYYIDQFQYAQLNNYSDYAFYFCYDWSNPQQGPMTKPGATLTAFGGAKIEASCRGALNYMLGQGYPAGKIIMGNPFYASNQTQWRNAPPEVKSNTATPDAASLEVQIGGFWWNTPNALRAKMAAVLDPAQSVLQNRAVLGGVGWWEWGYENPASPDLSGAIKNEAAAKYGR
jgi:hypothetical protein